MRRVRCIQFVLFIFRTEFITVDLNERQVFLLGGNTYFIISPSLILISSYRPVISSFRLIQLQLKDEETSTFATRYDMLVLNLD